MFGTPLVCLFPFPSSQTYCRDDFLSSNPILSHFILLIVNPKGQKFDGLNETTIPWERCDSATECIRWAADVEVQASFDVTFEVVGKYLIREESSCGMLNFSFILSIVHPPLPFSVHS